MKESTKDIIKIGIKTYMVVLIGFILMFYPLFDMNFFDYGLETAIILAGGVVVFFGMIAVLDIK